MSNELGSMHNKIVPRQFEDLRGWIDALRDEGELQEIDVEVDWDCELGTVARKTFGQGNGPALLFNNITGYGEGDDVYSRRVFTGGLSNYKRVAMMLGLPKDAPVRDLVLATRHFLQQRVEPVEVKEGKVKENIVTGDDIDIYKVPVPRWHRKTAADTSTPIRPPSPWTRIQDSTISVFIAACWARKTHCQFFCGGPRTGVCISRNGLIVA